MTDLIAGRFEVLETLGRGAQGVVLLARDCRHDRLVALKIRRSVGSDRAVVGELVLGETRALLAMAPHPGVVLVRDDFFDGDDHVMVMDWVPGTSLAELLDAHGDPGLSPTTVLAYVEQVANALDHLHGHEPPIVHGDVKPANLIVTARDRVVLVDFGIATTTGAYLGAGTPGYTAPEVAAGQFPTPAADIYGLAATVFELLTGAPPTGVRPDWEGTDPARVPALERALRRGLAVDPARRPRTAGELLERIRAWRGADLPTGVVTFCLTDIERSTSLWEQHPGEMATALARHDALVAHAVEDHGGRLIKTQGEGDSTLSVFPRASLAVAAALAIHHALAHEDWHDDLTIAVRIALHTGEAQLRDGDYYGTTLNRAARLRALAQGDQILLSAATAAVIADELPQNTALVDLGEHTLQGLTRPERILELTIAGITRGLRPYDTTTGHVPSALKTPSADGHNLPVARTTFVGREAELSELERLLENHRLVTITGTGGAGKTRLSSELATRLLPRYQAGAWLVRLDTLTDGRLVVPTVMAALGIPEEPGCPPLTTLQGALRTRRMLLVLDNCERHIDACAEAVASLLSRTEALVIVTTSREPLAVVGEHVWQVPPLRVPETTETTPEALETVDAARLFVDRAASARPGFALTAVNAAAVAEICRRLDGIPLAIELAASRVRVLEPAEIVQRLDDRLALLQGGRTMVERQRTLRATVEWSHDLLEVSEQMLFRRLAVFAGRFTLAAVEVVCTGGDLVPTDVIESLSQLVAKSLAHAEPRGTTTRFRLLEMVRDLAAEKLEFSGEREAFGRRHVDFYRAWATSHAPMLTEQSRAEALELFEAERDNLRAALATAIASDDADAALGLVASCWRFLEERSAFAEAEQWCERALGCGADTDASGLRAEVTAYQAKLAQRTGDASRAVTLAEHALLLAEKCADDRGVALARIVLGAVANAHFRRAGDARHHNEHALEAARRAGDPTLEVDALLSLGAILRDQGRLAEGRERCEAALMVAERIGHAEPRAFCLYELGETSFQERNPSEALSLWEEALRLAREMNLRQLVAFLCSSIGGIRLYRGDIEGARQLVEQSLEYFRETGRKLQTHIDFGTLSVIHRVCGTFEAAREAAQEGLAISREIEEPAGVAMTLCNLGELALDQNDNDAARTHFEEALMIAEGIEYSSYRTRPLMGLAELDRRARRLPKAERGAEQALAIARATHEPFDLVGCSRLLGDIARSAGDVASARARHREAIRIAIELEQRLEVWPSLEGLAAVSLDHPTEAARLLGAAEVLREATHSIIAPAQRVDHDEIVAAVEALLPKHELAAAWASGRAAELVDLIRVQPPDAVRSE
jgi:predicted ATPase/class 3 adenylate cyclase